VLNANVAFLSIQSVDTNSDPYRSPAQISSYCSIAASIGSIILGLILVRQSRTKHGETASDVVSDLINIDIKFVFCFDLLHNLHFFQQDFLRLWTHRWLGLEILAIAFSLPYALLMWG
jgi:hypothetical protein